MNNKILLELILAFCIVIGVLGQFALRYQASKKGLGQRGIKVLTIVMVVPGTLILGLEGILDSQAIAAILSGTLGYVFGAFTGDES